ncbi:MAG: class I SAM-dependent methyltransferase [Candidatus Promineifilaceae bacterium]|nr:class I SAM-dependent methyltransferase [Candidatus Promineifilaceae bacterium]
MKEGGAANNLQHFSGTADVYDVYRPRPPAVIPEMLVQVANVAQPDLVVDLGCGTGHSTYIWSERARQVIGIEPNEDMRALAQQRQSVLADVANVTFREGVASDTALDDGTAEVVTCAQSLHWMEPESTFQEIARILRPGGIFAAYDYHWPPVMRWDLATEFEKLLEKATKVEEGLESVQSLQQWAKAGHLERMKSSGLFRFVTECHVHQKEVVHTEQLIGLALSSGPVRTAIKHGLPEAQIGLDAFRAKVEETVGNESVLCLFSYVVRIGIK